MGCATGTAKFILIFFNIIFWLSGACILGIGIWLRVDKNILDIFQIASVSTSGGQLDHAAYILIGFGAFVFLVGFLGCCGAWHTNKVMLGLYIFFLLVVMIGELAAGIYAAVQRNQITNELKASLKSELLKDQYIADPAANPVTYTVLASSMNSVQWRFDCCGVDGYLDYASNGTTWPKMVGGMSRAYPFTCCNVTSTVQDPRKLTAAEVLNATLCYSQDPMYFHGQGCYTSIENEIKSHAVILIGVGIGLALLEIIGVICAIIVCRAIDKDD